MNIFKKITLVVILGLVLVALYIANKAITSNQTSKPIDAKVISVDNTPRENDHTANDENKAEIERYRTKRIVPKEYKENVTRLLIYEGIADPKLDSVYIYKLSDKSTGVRYILGDANILEMAIAAEHGVRTLQKGEQYGAIYNDKFATFVPRELADDNAPDKLIWGEKQKNTVAPVVKQLVEISGLSKYKDLTIFVATKKGYKAAAKITPSGDVSLSVAGVNICEIGIYDITEQGSSAIWISKGDWAGKGNIAFNDLKNELSGDTRTVVITNAKKDPTFELSFVMDENDVMPLKALTLGGDSELHIKLPVEAKFYCVFSPDGKSSYLPIKDKIDLNN